MVIFDQYADVADDDVDVSVADGAGVDGDAYYDNDVVDDAIVEGVG